MQRSWVPRIQGGKKEEVARGGEGRFKFSKATDQILCLVDFARVAARTSCCSGPVWSGLVRLKRFCSVSVGSPLVRLKENQHVTWFHGLNRSSHGLQVYIPKKEIG